MKRFMSLVIAAAALVLAAGAVAAEASTRPDDRATHGPGALVALYSAIDAVRPDDRAWRGIGPVPTFASGQYGSLRPDDRATHGPGAIDGTAASDVARPDDRAWRGVGPAPTIVAIDPPSTRVDGFDWADAGIGATAAIGLGLLLAGATALTLRRQRVTAFS